MPGSYRSDSRATIFISHAAPEDNQFALWLSSKLVMAGYRVWVDRNRLRGGHDFWEEIERVLRNDAVKQIVVFTKHVRNSGVKKELALGEVIKGRLGDPNFIIGIRNDDSAFGDAPPELLRSNIIDAFPNWHDCLKSLLDTLEEYGVPREAGPDTRLLTSIVEAREDGRRFVTMTPETALTNWFPITPPRRMRYFRFDGLQEHMQAWCSESRLPHVRQGRLLGTFADRQAFLASSSFIASISDAYDLPFTEFIESPDAGPYVDRQSARNDAVNLLRQHFDQAASHLGLLPFHFGTGDVGWFFPDALVPGNKVVCHSPDGRKIRRAVSGRFKTLRWHLCIVAKPRIWPVLVYRLHANIVLSTDGKTPIPGERTHLRRRRLTRSWWNDVWRDRLLASMKFLADGGDTMIMRAGDTSFQVSTWPLLAELPVSYEVIDSCLPSEEDEEGNILPDEDLDTHSDDLDEPIELDDIGRFV
jgi:hypothetical protein